MPAISQGLRDDGLAAATPLSLAVGIHSHELPTGACSLVVDSLEELTPSGIVDRLCQYAAGEALNVQVFHGDQPVAVDQDARGLVLAVVALVSDVGMCALEQ